MPENLDMQWYALLLAVPAMLIAVVQVLIARYGTGNKALGVAVQAQSQVQDLLKWQMEFIMSQAESRGAADERLRSLQAQLDSERTGSRELRENMIRQDTETQAALERSNNRIEDLTEQIQRLQVEMHDIQAKLDATLEEKRHLETAKAVAEKNVLDLQVRMEKISHDTEKIRLEMTTMRDGYEKRIRELEAQIAAKDQEIERLRKVLKGDGDEKPVESI